MRYPTILVCLKLGSSNQAILEVTRQLAERFQAKVIGLTVYRPIQALMPAPSPMAAEVIETDQAERALEQQQAEVELRGHLAGSVENIEYRAFSTFSFISDQVAMQARSADLCIVEGGKYGLLQDSARYLDLSDLVVALGRPLLVVPKGTKKIELNSALVAWKDSKEARRAVQDALPLLSLFKTVTVGAVSQPEFVGMVEESLASVVGWLKQHGIVAATNIAPSAGDDAIELNNLAQFCSASLVVAGAYGHTRMREWVLGGVTRELLLRPQRCAVLSH